MARARRVLAWGGGVALALLLLALGAFLFVNRTERGQKLVLAWVLERIEGAIDGEIEVEGIRSRGLLQGATLYGVTVRESGGGRPLLTADSARTTYDWRTFLSGDVVLATLDVWGGRLTVSRYPGEEDFNLDRVLFSRAPREEAADPDAPVRTLTLNDVRLVDAFIEIVRPVDPADPAPPRAVTVEVPGVPGEMSRIWFEDIQAVLPSVRVSGDELPGPEVEVGALSLTGFVYEDPLFLTQLEGLVSWVDGRLTIAAEEMSMPRTTTSGTIVADFTEEARSGRETGWAVELRLDSPAFALADLWWLLPDLPDGTGAGAWVISFDDLGDVRVGFADATLEVDGGRLAGEGAFVRSAAGTFAFEDMSLTAERVALALLEPWVGELPLSGTLTGRAALDGPMSALRASGNLTLREPGYQPTTADFAGTFHLTERQGVTDLVADLAPLDFRLVQAFLPASPFTGSGRARVRASGRVAEGVRYDVEVAHQPLGGALPASQVQARGVFRGVGEAYDVELEADVSPLSLTALREYFPQLPLSGEVAGRITASGPLGDLRVTTDLETEAGRLAVTARFDARDPRAFYSVEGEVEDFLLSALSPELPEPTSLTGYVRVEGRGTDLATASLDVVLHARDSRIWELPVDTADLTLRVRDGRLSVDAGYARVADVELRASGELATTEAGTPGTVRVIFSADSLTALRAALEAGDVLVRDGLTALERDALIAQGVDPDTLPVASEVELGGRVSGDVTLVGSTARFTADGVVSLESLRYGAHAVRGAEVTFTAEGLPDFGEALAARLVADSVQLFGRQFAAADATVDFARPEGTAELRLVRSEDEDYYARGSFALDSLGGRALLDALDVRMDTVTWRLEAPARLAWDARSVTIEELRVVEDDGDGVRLVASGTIPREGEADFSLAVERLDLTQVAHLLQRGDLDLAGQVAIDLDVRGTAERPFVAGTVEATGVRYQGYDVERVGGELEYRDRRIALDLEAWEGDLRVLRADGVIPAVLDLTGPSLTFPDEAISLTVAADSLPAAFATAFFEILTDVEGTVAGTFAIGGTLDEPEPIGSLRLQDAAWTIESLGVRHENVTGDLVLRRDGTVEVDATAQADGLARVTGSILLAPLKNPGFDLAVSFDGFRAVERRDAEASVSGIVRLTGRFDAPLVQGLGPAEGLRVESGVLYLDEFVRAATVVDLTDPRFEEFLEDALAEARVVEESRNLFMQNLRVEVDVAVQQDAWLRSTEMNVEIGGNLRVTYDRPSAELVLNGVLDARRGSYTVLGQRFDVQEGQVEFIGIPGIDPNLNILARSRVRRQSAEPLEIDAQVTGTLSEPQVVLSSDEAAISQSDLMSYLLFGQPSYELASGQRQQLESAAGSFVGTVVTGTVASRLGSLLARRWGLDYFAINELGAVGWNLGSVTQTQVEFGRYLRDDLFLVVAFQPTQVVTPNPFGTFGVRLEFRPSTRYTLEAFWEDRFLRNPALGFQDALFDRQKILGLFLFTEWGY